MNPFEMVVIIVALGILGGVIKHYFDSRGDLEASSKERRHMEKHIAELEKRIRILERIVTDEDYDLKQQFRDLDKEE
ncbi:hypothetical protein [Thiolapillus brandeum]|uniref:Phage shock protein B n=1 Tax=Thiolapillus brandeum TaxID=1076588 RepID=A0A7U6GHY0_9GAMM|nr:hypothetical protein [Thiolapillus brandeum]BAO43940.1 conserved hypothetical protein [Thiolapillus brandeum]